MMSVKLTLLFRMNFIRNTTIFQRLEKMSQMGILGSVYLNNVLIMIHKFKHEKKIFSMIS